MIVADLIQQAMSELENMPGGAVGAGGFTLSEIDLHSQTTGGVIEDDAAYHTAQRAWRLLEQAMAQQEAKP
jgi:hypothetical protein